MAAGLQQWYAQKFGASISMVDVGGGIELEVATAGNPANPLVVCYHGFPSAACMLYKHQIRFLADLGYHVAVPCLRGFGHSSAPARVSDYSAIAVGKDIAGSVRLVASAMHIDTTVVMLVKALGHSECIAVAHDWGALQCWHHALLYPDIIKALFIVSIPCWEGCPRVATTGPGATMDPLAFARQVFVDKFWYLCYHNYDYLASLGRPEDEYDGNLEVMFRKLMQNRYAMPADAVVEEPATLEPLSAPGLSAEDTGWLCRMPLLAEGQDGSFVDDDDKKYWVAQFAHSGFKHPVDYYRNVDRNWRDFERFQGRRIEQPTSWIGGGADSCVTSNSRNGWLTPPHWDGTDAAVWQDAMRAIVPNLQELQVVPGMSHWLLMEAPAAVNEQLARFLAHPATLAALDSNERVRTSKL